MNKAELLKSSKKLQAQMSTIKLPVLIMHGTADRLADVVGSETLYERVGSKEKTLKLYDGAYHDIFNELNSKQVFSDLDKWLYTHRNSG
ncbi:serine aminopeptidase domain-containing protein [Chloroflexota bacterium]